MLVVTLEQMHALFTFANIFVVKIARDLRDGRPKKVAVLLDFVQITPPKLQKVDLSGIQNDSLSKILLS